MGLMEANDAVEQAAQSQSGTFLVVLVVISVVSLLVMLWLGTTSRSAAKKSGYFTTVSDRQRSAARTQAESEVFYIDPADGLTLEPRAIVVVCELHEQSARRLSFNITEFVELDNGSRLVVRADRGWTTSGANSDESRWKYQSVSRIESQVVDLWDLYVEEEAGLDWMIPILQERGVHADLAVVELLPVVVELSQEIHHMLAEWGRVDDPPSLSDDW